MSKLFLEIDLSLTGYLEDSFAAPATLSTYIEVIGVAFLFWPSKQLHIDIVGGFLCPAMNETADSITCREINYVVRSQPSESNPDVYHTENGEACMLIPAHRQELHRHDRCVANMARIIEVVGVEVGNR